MESSGIKAVILDGIDKVHITNLSTVGGHERGRQLSKAEGWPTERGASTKVLNKCPLELQGYQGSQCDGQVK